MTIVKQLEKLNIIKYVLRPFITPECIALIVSLEMRDLFTKWLRTVALNHMHTLIKELERNFAIKMN